METLWKESFRRLFELCPEPVLVFRSDGALLDFNSEASSTLGLSLSDRGKKSFLDRFVSFKQRQDFLGLLASQGADQSVEPLEMELDIGGLRMNFLAQIGSFTNHERFDGVMVFLKDRTEAAKLSEMLREYRFALDQASIVAVTDLKGRITFVNDNFCNISGYSRQELLGKTHSIINSGHHPREFFREMWASISSGKVWRGEIKNRTKSGQFYWVDTTLIPLLSADGKSGKYMAIRTDITERKNLQNELLRQDRLASVGLLSSGLAHEVGTPLGVIRGRAELLQMTLPETSESARTSLSVIVSQIDRISKLISSLLRFSRNSDDVVIRPLDFNSIVREVLLLLEPRIHKHKIKVNSQIEKNLTVLGDSARLQQILINLLMNAVQAIESVKRSGDLIPGEISILARSKVKGEAEIEIRDNGCGIAENQMDRLFQPLYTTKPVGEGTGLGLAIVLKLVTEMKGRVRVQSKEGLGASFFLTLPRAQKTLDLSPSPPA